MLRKAHVDRRRISPFQAAALERFVEHGFITDAHAGDRDTQTLEIAVVLELAGIDEALADQERSKPVARTVMDLVRHDFEADAALDHFGLPREHRHAEIEARQQHVEEPADPRPIRGRLAVSSG